MNRPIEELGWLARAMLQGIALHAISRGTQRQINLAALDMVVPALIEFSPGDRELDRVIAALSPIEVMEMLRLPVMVYLVLEEAVASASAEDEAVIALYDNDDLMMFVFNVKP